jgi:hypothetical protein
VGSSILAICIDFFDQRGQIELEEDGNEPNTANLLRFFDVNFLYNIDKDVLDDSELVRHSSLQCVAAELTRCLRVT